MSSGSGPECLDPNCFISEPLGGRCTCTESVKSSSKLFDASSSDEFINYSDTELTGRSEDPTTNSLKVAAATSYD